MQTFSTSNFTGRISCKSEKFVFLIKSPESSLLPLPNHLLNKNSLVCQKLEMDVVCHAIYWNQEPDISYKAWDYAETDPTFLLQRNSSLFHHIPVFTSKAVCCFERISIIAGQLHVVFCHQFRTAQTQKGWAHYVWKQLTCTEWFH